MYDQYMAVDLPGQMLYEKEFSVKIRKITPIEQKYIISLSTKEQRTSKDYLDFLKKLIVISDPEVQFEDLFYFDLRYILYRIHFVTYSAHPFKLEFVCGKETDAGQCNQKIIKELNANELVIHTPDDLPELIDTIELENLGTLHIRNKILRDDITIENFIRTNKLDPNDLQINILLLDLCAISVDRDIKELYAAACTGELTVEDIIKIEDWINNTVWGVDETVNIKCPVCGMEESREYFLSLEDFFSAY